MNSNEIGSQYASAVNDEDKKLQKKIFMSVMLEILDELKRQNDLLDDDED